MVMQIQSAVRQQPQYESRDPRSGFDKDLERLFQALQIANTGFGIAVNYQNFQKYRQERANMPTPEQAAQANALDLEMAQANLGKVNADTAKQTAETVGLPTAEEAAASRSAANKKLFSEIDETKARTGLYGAQAAAVVPEQERKNQETTLKNAMDLRKEWQNDPTTRATKEVKIAFDRFQAIKNEKTPTAAGDHALIFSYMKTIEPGMAVREGEFATVENTKGKVDKYTIGLFNKTSEGRLLTDEQRAQLSAVTERLQNAQIENQNRLDEHYKRLARDRGIAENDVVLPLFGANDSQQPTPEEIAAEIRRRGYK